MTAANASARGQRVAILASPLHELTGFLVPVDCLAPGCNGERRFAVAELASFYGQDTEDRCRVACGAQAPVVGVWARLGWSRADPRQAAPCAAAGARGAG
jgi:hypothetical protein